MPTPEDVLAEVQFEKEEVRKLFEHAEQLIVGVINHPFVPPEERIILRHSVQDLQDCAPLVQSAIAAIRSLFTAPPP